MTTEERIAINERIEAMIGSREDLNSKIENLELSDRIKERESYNKIHDKLFKIAEKSGEKALMFTMIQDTANSSHGITNSGKYFTWTLNSGYTARSRYCGTLEIAEIGVVFTSGTVAKALEYILNN